MTDNDERPVATVSHHFPAPPEEVFDAWLEPELLRRWMAGAVSDLADGGLETAEVDARVGGHFTFADRRRGELAVHRGTYLEIDRPRRLVFTWLPEPTPPDEHSVVTITIEATAGGCLLTLTHEMEPEWGEYVDRTELGWSTMCRQIERFLVPEGAEQQS